MHRLIRLVVGTAGISVLLLSGCGGGGGSTSAQPTPSGGVEAAGRLPLPASYSFLPRRKSSL